MVLAATGMNGLTKSCIRVPEDIVVWIYHTFDNNLKNQNDFTKYLKEMCQFCSD